MIYVEEADTIRTCHRLARRGFLFGGSTGTVVSGAMSWLDAHDADGLTAVAIAPDFGERYLDTIYQANWVADLYGADVVCSEELEDVSSLSDCERAGRQRPRVPPTPQAVANRFKESTQWQIQSTL